MVIEEDRIKSCVSVRRRKDYDGGTSHIRSLLHTWT